MGRLEEICNIKDEATAQTVAFSLPSPLQKLESSFLKEQGVDIWVKRDDLIHPHVSGNKYRKLVPHLHPYLSSKKRRLVTAGGAFSNHLVATAAFCALHEIPCLGLVKYHEIDLQNPTMRQCHHFGMELLPIDRKTAPLEYSNESDYWIPEGGAEELSAGGMKDLVDEIEDVISPDAIVVSAGLGGTACGIASFAKKDCRVIACSTFEKDSIEGWVSQQESWKRIEWHNLKGQFGKFGSYREKLVHFSMNFYNQFGILPDPLYTSKTFAWLLTAIKLGHFPRGAKLVAIHTGGLQGWDGFRWRYSEVNKSRK